MCSIYMVQRPSTQREFHSHALVHTHPTTTVPYLPSQRAFGFEYKWKWHIYTDHVWKIKLWQHYLKCVSFLFLSMFFWLIGNVEFNIRQQNIHRIRAFMHAFSMWRHLLLKFNCSLGCERTHTHARISFVLYKSCWYVAIVQKWNCLPPVSRCSFLTLGCHLLNEKFELRTYSLQGISLFEWNEWQKWWNALNTQTHVMCHMLSHTKLSDARQINR